MTDYRALRNAIVFREPLPSGYTMPAPDQIASAFGKVETELDNAVENLQKAEQAEAEEITEEGAREYRDARRYIIAALVAGILLAAAIGALVTRLIKKQLASVGRALAGVAKNDLTVPAEVRSRDELGRMAAAVNRAREGLRTTVGKLSG